MKRRIFGLCSDYNKFLDQYGYDIADNTWGDWSEWRVSEDVSGAGLLTVDGRVITANLLSAMPHYIARAVEHILLIKGDTPKIINGMWKASDSCLEDLYHATEALFSLGCHMTANPGKYGDSYVLWHNSFPYNSKIPALCNIVRPEQEEYFELKRNSGFAGTLFTFEEEDGEDEYLSISITFDNLRQVSGELMAYCVKCKAYLDDKEKADNGLAPAGLG